jgi:hypothetical protein
MWGYLKRGVAAGTVAGLGYGILLAIVGNPLTTYVAEAAHHGHEHEAHAVSETTTAVVSVGSGVLWGIFLGAVFGVAYYFIEPTVPGTERLRPVVLAGAGFFTVSIAPWLVLPPAAPGVEQSLGTRTRLLLYGSMMIAGAAVAMLAIGLSSRFVYRGRVAAVLAGLAPIALTTVVVTLVTPSVTTTGELSTELVTLYRGFVVLGQATLWLGLAGSYGWLERRALFEGPVETADGAATVEA